MKSTNTDFLTIGVLAKSTEVNVETIRFYQRRGLMDEPDRPAGGIRRYGEADADRIRFIKSAQKLGFSLDEISILLALDDGADCASAVSIAQKKLLDVRGKIADLRRIEKSLSGMIGECKKNSGGEVCCPMITSLKAKRPVEDH